MIINKLHIALFILIAAFISACDEYTDTEVASPIVASDNPSARFSAENPTYVKISADDLTFPITIVRTNDAATIEVPITVTDTAGVFTVPSSVSFPAGETSVDLTVSLNENTPQATYALELQLDDSYTNPYLVESPFLKVEVQAPCPDNEVTIAITFDGYASECSWEITDSNGTPVESSEAWADGTESASTDVCLIDGVYTFTVYDAYGDGLSYPADGTVTVSMGGEVLFTVSGDYGTEASGTFTLGGD